MTSGDGGSGERQVVKETSLVWPILTHTNYTEWTMLMKINYEAMEACGRP
jgi:hypothetical protein